MDWLASALTIVSVYFFQQRHLYLANLIGLINQIPWWTVMIQTRSWGLAPVNVVMLVMYAWGTWRNRK